VLAGIGVIIGASAAAGLTRTMSSLLFGVNPFDARTFLTVPVLLLVVALAACAVPAMRATRTDSIIALRGD
jgi:ABC-type antimicrobial peptide transport system permease subunit